MTVSNLNTRTDAVGDGSTTVFSYNFDLRREQDMSAYLDGVVEAGFSVDLINSQVTFTVPPGVGVQVTLLRDTTLTQQIDYTEYDRFPAETHEGGLDNSTLQDQELDERLDRSLTYGVIDAPAGGAQLPAPEADKAIGYDASGNLTNIIVREGGGLPVENPLLEDLHSGGNQFSVSQSGITSIGGLGNAAANVLLQATNLLQLTGGLGATLNGVSIVTEAPIDGNQYARRSGNWFQVETGTTASDTPPANPLPEDYWYNTLTGRLYQYYADGSSTQWVEVGPGVISGTGALISVQVFSSAGSFTYTKPGSLIYALVFVIGGGGGGGAAAATGAGQACTGGGGGGGGGAIRVLNGAAIGATEPVTVGAGGASPANNTPGVTGGTSSFGALCSASGGTGAVRGVPSSSSNRSIPGVGGAGLIGDLLVAGSAGQYGVIDSGNPLFGGNGGAGAIWSGASLVGDGGQGSAGAVFGGGGAGSTIFASTGATDGGTGADGLVAVIEVSL